MLYQLDPTQPWKKASESIAKAVKGSSLAIVGHPGFDELTPFVYYQDPQLHIRARCPSGTRGEWVLSE